MESITDLIQQEKKLFEDKQLIKPWLQSKLTLKGINIVIERSDESKIVFKCKCSNNDKEELISYKQERKYQLKNKDNNVKYDVVQERKKIRDLKKKFNCPFRIRANYSYRSKNWSLVVVNETHNHPLFPISSSSPLSSQLNSPQPSGTSSTTSQGLTTTSANSNYNYSSRVPSLPTSSATSLSNSSSSTHIPLILQQQQQQQQQQSTSPVQNIPILKNLNELQLEFNNSLLRLNCSNQEDEIKSIYIKLLKVLNQEQEIDYQQQQQQQQQQQTFGSLFSNTATTPTNINKTVLPSIHETFRYHHQQPQILKKSNVQVSSGDETFLRF